ncbi:MAG: HipA N-terminal domain-containing protein [Chitinophagaceae bacterium]|nr:HipA N-terminal domain-containing protein [Oligoflexus sp.]
MRKARVFVNSKAAGLLIEQERGKNYEFLYDDTYVGNPVSLSMPVHKKRFMFDSFPPFFDGLLPEGDRLEALLRKRKLDSKNYMEQLIAVGSDMVGTVTVKGLDHE